MDGGAIVLILLCDLGLGPGGNSVSQGVGGDVRIVVLLNAIGLGVDGGAGVVDVVACCVRWCGSVRDAVVVQAW